MIETNAAKQTQLRRRKILRLYKKASPWTSPFCRTNPIGGRWWLGDRNESCQTKPIGAEGLAETRVMREPPGDGDTGGRDVKPSQIKRGRGIWAMVE
jgi:hypothetical protein